MVAALRNQISEVLDFEASPGNVNVDLLIPALELIIKTSLAGQDAGDEPMLRLLNKQSTLSIMRNDDLDYYKKIPIKLILNSLTTLCFHNCGSFQDVELPSTIKSLYIIACDALTTIPDQFLAGCRSLQFFKIFICPSLKYLPSIPSTSGESTLWLEDLPALESLPDGLHSNTALRRFSILHCLNLVLPQEGFPVKLERLQIRSWGTWRRRSVPESTYLRSISEVKLSNLTSLTHLTLEGFDGTFTQDNCLPISIEDLYIRNFPRLESLSGVAPSLTHLSKLMVENCPLVTEKKWLEVLKLIPEQCWANKI